MYKVSILVSSIFAFALIGCDKVDSCLDSGGCWDKVDNVCRKSEPNAQELCDRKNSFSPKPWLEDYLALREHISKSYANLEYIIKYYKIDAHDLNEKTISAINASKTEKEAREALDQFVNTFKDGHFRLRKPEGPKIEDTTSSTQIDNNANGETACKAMEFSWDKKFAFRFPIEGVKVRDKAEGEFPYLVVEKGGTKVGIIRIADFRDEVFPQTCIEVWNKYAKALKTKCDEQCRDDFRHKAMRTALVDKFYAALTNVRKANVKALVVDLTHNGGGTDWVEDITALLTDKKLICGRRGFIKHPHHVKNFTELLTELRSERKPQATKIKSIERQLKLASENCDRTPIWTQKGFTLTCSAVGYGTGDSCKYESMKFKGKTKYTGKLFFLVDDYTASAAEDIVARHLDSNAAKIIGGHTHGSGCGYMNGGIKFSLPHSGLDVRVPDCIRERADGTNEVVGIEPDIKMDMSKLGDPAFLSGLVEKVTSSL
ncbi:MAG: S41 family peptidase [Bdellovibrionaceae bacterium]|nr:S41 family peptidase [Pseudobdellovibrionaceae bacterium]